MFEREQTHIQDLSTGLLAAFESQRRVQRVLFSRYTSLTIQWPAKDIVALNSLTDSQVWLKKHKMGHSLYYGFETESDMAIAADLHPDSGKIVGGVIQATKREIIPFGVLAEEEIQKIYDMTVSQLEYGRANPDLVTASAVKPSH